MCNADSMLLHHSCGLQSVHYPVRFFPVIHQVYHQLKRRTLEMKSFKSHDIAGRVRKTAKIANSVKRTLMELGKWNEAGGNSFPCHNPVDVAIGVVRSKPPHSKQNIVLCTPSSYNIATIPVKSCLCSWLISLFLPFTVLSSSVLLNGPLY